MKKINKIPIWNNGVVVYAEFFTISCNAINLYNSASFNYSLISIDGVVLTSGGLLMNSEDYENWISDDYVWDWAAQQLNIEYDLDNSVDSNS